MYGMQGSLSKYDNGIKPFQNPMFRHFSAAPPAMVRRPPLAGWR